MNLSQIHLNPTWGKGCRFGLISSKTNELTIASDSLDFIKARLKANPNLILIIRA
jgi:hypothetical protein